MMKMFGVGPALGPQLMTEIGDVRQFRSKKALVPFSGIDAPPNDSGQVIGNSKGMSKIGSAQLRRILFLIMSVYLQSAPSTSLCINSWTKSALRASLIASI